MPKEFKFDNITGKTLYRNHRAETFQPYTKEMKERDEFMSKMVVEENTLFSKPVTTTPPIVETPTTEGDTDMQECCTFYDNLVPFSCRHRGLDEWDLLWQCSVCGQWYKIEFMYNNLTPRIKNIQEVDFSIYFAVIRHDKLDIFQLRNLQEGVPIFDHIRNTAADFEVTRKYDWMCPNCTFNPETILGDEGNTYRCGDCGTTYKLWANDHNKTTSYIKLNKPKVEAPVVVEKPQVEDAPVQEETTVEEAVEVNESPNEIVEDTVVEETTTESVMEDTPSETETILPTVIDGKIVAPSLVPQETTPEWSEDIIDEMMDTGELPEAFTAPNAEDIPDDNYLKEDKESDTTTIPEEGILIARGIPDWMCDDCLENYNDVTLVDLDNTPAYQCNTCDVIYYVERVGEEQDIVYKQFKQITPEEMTAMYVTTDSTPELPVEPLVKSPVTEEKDIFADKVVEALAGVEVEEDIIIEDEPTIDIGDEEPVKVDTEDEEDPLVLPDTKEEEIDIPDLSLDEIEFDEDIEDDSHHAQAIKEDLAHRDNVGEYHLHVNLPKGIQNVVVTNEQLSKGPLGQMLVNQRKSDDELTIDFDETSGNEFDTAPNNVVMSMEDQGDYKSFKALQELKNTWDPGNVQSFKPTVTTKPIPLEVHTLDFIVNGDSSSHHGKVKVYKNEMYSFEVESFSARMASAGDDAFDIDEDSIVVIVDDLAEELGSWDAMIYEMRLTSGELFHVFIDLAMLGRVTIGFK